MGKASIKGRALAGSAPPPNFCDYAAQVVGKRLDKLLSLVDNVRRSEDTEAVHQMRVASRRARVAIKSFETCFPVDDYVRLGHVVKDVTRVLSEARDLDVMAETLIKDQFELPLEERRSLESFVDNLRKQRQEKQRTVFKAVERLEDANLKKGFDEIVDACGKSHRKGHAKPKDIKSRAGVRIDSKAPLLVNSEKMIGARIDEILAYRNYVRESEAVCELHEMRIAGKRLRYTLEIIQDAYDMSSQIGPQLKAVTKEVEQVQESLGALHDADVLVPKLTEYLAHQLKQGYGADGKGAPVTGVHRIDNAGCQGLMRVIGQIGAVRDARYEQFLNQWLELEEQKVFAKFRRLLSDAAQVKQNEDKVGAEHTRRLPSLAGL